MDAQEVKFKRKTTEQINNLEIEDGALIYNIDNGKTYMDYGNQRIQTGGNADTMIYVGDDEPTDPDIVLWIDENENNTKASEIVNEYTESDNVGYSTNYINDIDNYIQDMSTISSEEKFIGYYIEDGVTYKKYSKTYKGTLNIQQTSSSQSLFHTPTGCDKVLNYYGTFSWQSYTQTFPIIWGTSTCSLRKVNENIHWFSNFAIGSGTYRITLEYTKAD